MIAASEIRPMTALVAHKSSLPGPFVSLKSQGDANNTAANSRLYKSNTDSRCHFLMTRSPRCVDIEKTCGNAAGSNQQPGFGSTLGVRAPGDPSLERRSGAKIERLH